MRIMCLNAWGGTLHDRLLPYLADAAPDVLCLQEVIHSPATGAEWLTYRDGSHILQQRANLFREVCRALPGHAATFCPAAQGVLWDGDRSVPSRWGLATFVGEVHAVTGQAQGFVHKSYGADGYGTHPRSRSGHGVRLHDHVRNRAVSVTHMHGLRDLRGKMDTPERDRQAERLLALAERVTEPGGLSIICGDFNVAPDSATLRLLRDAGFAELVTRHAPDGTRSSHYSKPGRFADYMLISDERAVEGFAVIRHPEVSDHCPLLLEV